MTTFARLTLDSPSGQRAAYTIPAALAHAIATAHPQFRVSAPCPTRCGDDGCYEPCCEAHKAVALRHHDPNYCELAADTSAIGPCLDHYAGDMVCGQPAGHPVDVAKPDTWHRYGTVRWC